MDFMERLNVSFKINKELEYFQYFHFALVVTKCYLDPEFTQEHKY